MLAARFGWEALDADIEIERRSGKSIAEIFAGQGEEAFREVEAEVIGELVGREQIVLAAGGGAVLREENRLALRSMAAVVWLQARAETLWQRISTDATTGERRPNLTVAGGLAEVQALLSDRQELYRATATIEVDTEGSSPAEVAEQIYRLLPARPSDDCPA
jgi:shikimate kinase